MRKILHVHIYIVSEMEENTYVEIIWYVYDECADSLSHVFILVSLFVFCLL